MNYQISISYTDNPNKAGKLTLRDSTNRVILNKVPVSIPDKWLQSDEKLNRLNISMEYKDIVPNMKLSADAEYNKVVKKLNELNLDSIIKTNTDYSFISNTISSNGLLNSTQDSFVVSNQDYEILQKSSSLPNSFNSNKVTLTVEKVAFLWFPGNVNRDGNSLDVSKLLNLMDLKQRVYDDNQKETYAKPVDTSKGGKKPVSSSSKSPVTDNKVNQKDAQERTKQEDLRRQDEERRRNDDDYRRRQADEDYRRRNDLDAFDVVFMYNNPELAPMYKPNSMLAWALYFNRDDREVNNSSVRENINTIPGFEKVEHTEVKYSTSGYSVNMYEDEQKQKLIGTLVHDNNNNSYVMQDPNGAQTTTLNLDSNGDAKGYVYGEKGDTNFNFVQNGNGGYAGNWESESTQGIKISSGVSMSENFAPVSSPFEAVDVRSVIQGRDEQRYEQKYEPGPAPAYDNSYSTSPSLSEDKKYEPGPSPAYINDTSPKWEPPPPPPPPPPQDDTRWSSSNDSYNTGSSFTP